MTDDPSSRMIVVMDECMPVPPFHDFLVPRGHVVLGAGDAYAERSPDLTVLTAAHERGAVVMTTDRDWKVLLRRGTIRRAQYHRAGLIWFVELDQFDALRRLSDLIEVVEREHAIAQERGHQFIMWIAARYYSVER